MGQFHMIDVRGTGLTNLHRSFQCCCLHSYRVRQGQYRRSSIRNGDDLHTGGYVAVLILRCPGYSGFTQEILLRRIIRHRNREQICRFSRANGNRGFQSGSLNHHILRQLQDGRSSVDYCNILFIDRRIAVFIRGRPGDGCLAQREIRRRIRGDTGYSEYIRGGRRFQTDNRSPSCGFDSQIGGLHNGRSRRIHNRYGLRFGGDIAIGVCGLPGDNRFAERITLWCVIGYFHFKNIRGGRLPGIYHRHHCRRLRCNILRYG